MVRLFVDIAPINTVVMRRTMVRLYCRVIDDVAAAAVEGAAHDAYLAQLSFGDAKMASHGAPQLGGHHALLGREVDIYALRLRIHL